MTKKQRRVVLSNKQAEQIRKIKRCYEELRTLRQAMDRSGTMAWISDYRKGTIQVSDTWTKILGYEPEEVKSTLDFFVQKIHPEDRNRVLEIRRRHFEGEIPEFHAAFRMQRKDGKYRWIRTRGQVTERDQSGNVIKMIGIHEDITKQRHMTERIRESEEKYHAAQARVDEKLKHQKAIMDGLFRTSPDGLVMMSRDGIVQRINERFTDIFQYTSAEAVGNHIDDLIANEDQREEAELLNSKAKYIHHVEVETERSRKDGSIVPIMIRSQPYYLDGEIIGHQILYTDITQRKKEEEILRKAKEEADAANEAKSRFLSNISHEMRTPMNGIFGATMLLENTDLDEEQQELLNMLRESSDRMMNTVADLLDIARIEHGFTGLREEWFDLCQAISGIVEPFRDIGENRNIDFSFRCDDSLKLQVMGDRGKLCRVIYHLVSNAFKFTSEGSIAVEISLQEFQNPIGIFRFSVIDTGIGIDTMEAHQLFESFTQLDDSSTKSYQGTGLGLTIVHKLLEQMGGTVQVESNPWEGSRFYFDLPLKVESSEGDADSISDLNEAEFKIAKGSMQILAVEDDEISQILLKKLIERIGADLEVASDGIEAIQKYGQKKYDMILMDVQLPSISGLEVTEVIRTFERRTDEHTPIIGLSAHALNRDREECLASGMDDYMSKPIDFQQLLEIIEKWTHL